MEEGGGRELFLTKGRNFAYLASFNKGVFADKDREPLSDIAY